MSKKLEWEIFKSPQVFLFEVRHGVTTLGQLCEIFQMRKQNMRYYLKQLCDEGFLTQPTSGLYKITNTGKRICDQYERFRGKQLVRIENMHVTYHVIEGASKLLGLLSWKKEGLKRRVYTSKIDNHTVRLIKKEGGYNFEVYVTKILDVNHLEAYHQARIDADLVASSAEMYGVKLSTGWVSSAPEIAIPSPIASALLSYTGASQIRTDKGIFNRSKGRGADWEPRDLQQAQKIVDMPDAITRLEEKSDRHNEKLDRLLSLLRYSSNSCYSDLAGSSHLGFI